MKVLMVTPFFPPDKGGIANHVFSICARLSQTNEISLVIPKPLMGKIDIKKNVSEVCGINCIYPPGWPYSTLRSMSIPIDFGLKLDLLIRKGKFDIVHAHGHHFPLTWLAINSAYRYKIPSVITLHGTYALDPKAQGGKTVLEQLFNRMIFSKLLSKASAIVGVTEQVTSYAKQIGTAGLSYFTIANGVDTNLYDNNRTKRNEYRTKYHILHDKIVILFSGRFEHTKGIIEFAKAMRNIVDQSDKDIEIIIVGSGSLEEDVHSILGSRSFVHILPWQPFDKIHELYIASDIFVIPSRYEGLPISIIEAMNAGLHIVYTPVGGVPDILKGYSSKTLLSITSENVIQNVIVSLLENFSVKKNMDSLEYARQFDWDKTVSSINEVYRRLVRN